jgi:hypothetical protein
MVGRAVPSPPRSTPKLPTSIEATVGSVALPALEPKMPKTDKIEKIANTC